VEQELEKARERWRRFEVWERGWLRALPASDMRLIEWASDARELALKVDPSLGNIDRAEPGWREFAVLRRRLARALGIS